MAAITEVTLSLYLGNQEKEYTTVSLAEAREILAKKMNPGWRWTVSPWAYDGGTGEVYEEVLNTIWPERRHQEDLTGI